MLKFCATTFLLTLSTPTCVTAVKPLTGPGSPKGAIGSPKGFASKEPVPAFPRSPKATSPKTAVKNFGTLGAGFSDGYAPSEISTSGASSNPSMTPKSSSTTFSRKMSAGSDGSPSNTIKSTSPVQTTPKGQIIDGRKARSGSFSASQKSGRTLSQSKNEIQLDTKDFLRGEEELRKELEKEFGDLNYGEGVYGEDGDEFLGGGSGVQYDAFGSLINMPGTGQQPSLRPRPVMMSSEDNGLREDLDEDNTKCTLEDEDMPVLMQPNEMMGFDLEDAEDFPTLGEAMQSTPKATKTLSTPKGGFAKIRGSSSKM